MAAARPASHPFRAGPAAPGAQVELRGRPPLPLYDASRLRPARPRCGDPAGARRVAPAHSGTPRRRGVCGLARRPQCDLAAGRANNWRAPRGCRRIRCKKNSGQCEADHTGIFPCAGGSFIFFSSARRARFFLACGSQRDRADAGRDVQTGIAFNAERLKRNRPI
jgi:hypothetical protein